jgi:hypothetical protein
MELLVAGCESIIHVLLAKYGAISIKAGYYQASCWYRIVDDYCSTI